MKLYPALLVKRLDNAKRKLKIVSSVKRIHLDVMDGKFVKNKTINILKLQKLLQNKHVQAHVMCKYPESYIEDCKKIKCKEFIFHVEATNKVLDVIKEVKKTNMKVGLALNPKTSLTKIKPYLEYIDMVLVMGVQPGKSGQQFQNKVLHKIKKLQKHNVIIGVDGGIKKKMKTDFIVAASAIFNAKNPLQKIKELS